MTVGEKIQFYRKRAGLSQEELGQQLLVSRQTVSLWETGQTLPTLDNLSRLRSIFGVSVDELLREDDADTVGTERMQEPPLCATHDEGKARIGTRRTVTAHAVLTAASLFALCFAVISFFFTPVWHLICVIAGAGICFLCQAWLLVVAIAPLRAVAVEDGCEPRETGAFAAWLFPLHPLAASALTFLALLAALVIVIYGTVWSANAAALLLFVASGILVACGAVGVLRCRKKKCRRGTVLTGILLAALLSAGGVGALLRALPQPVCDTQRVLGMPLPACERVEMTEGGYAANGSYVYYRVDFYFGKGEAAFFERELAKSDTRLLTPTQSTLSCAPCADFGVGATYFWLYDARKSECVGMLDGRGYHDYFVLAYFPEADVLRVAGCNAYVAE